MLEEKDLQAIATMMDAMMDKKLEPIHTRLGEIEAQIDSMDTRMGSMKNRIDSMDMRLDSVESHMDIMEQDLTEAKALATKTQMILENDVARKIDSLYAGPLFNTEKLDVLINQFDDLETDMLAMEIITKKNMQEIHQLKRKAQ